jgi:hypothetical protein
MTIIWRIAAAPESIREGALKMQTRLLGLGALAALAAGFILFEPTKSFATTQSYLSSKGDNSVMYRRRHGADDGDADDLPGGYHAGEDDRDADDFRRGDEVVRNPATGAAQKTAAGRELGGDAQGKPKPDPIGR